MVGWAECEATGEATGVGWVLDDRRHTNGRGGGHGNGRVVGTNGLGGVVGAVNELNGSTYRFFIELDSTGLDVSWVQQARIGHGDARGVLWACVVLAKQCEGETTQ